MIIENTLQQKLEATVLVCALSNNKNKTRSKINKNITNNDLSLILTFEGLTPQCGQTHNFELEVRVFTLQNI